MAAVKLTLYDNDTSGTCSRTARWARLRHPLGHAGHAGGTSTTWTLPVTCRRAVTGTSRRTPGHRGSDDTRTSGATARYRIYPGDLPPTLTETLLSPTEGTTFTDGRIFVSGRAEDDKAMQAVQVAIVNRRAVHELQRCVPQHQPPAGAPRS